VCDRFTLATNNGENALHGGEVGFDKRTWSIVSKSSKEVKMRIQSCSGEEGYPGEMRASVTYSLERDDDLNGDVSLVTEFEATCDAPTLCSLANHAYWNLCGHDSGAGVLGHEIRIASNKCLPVDAGLIPTGVKASVKGGPFDFGVLRPIGGRIEGAYSLLFLLEASY